MDEQDYTDFEALIPEVDNDDVLQEAEVFKLENDGKTPHRGLIRHRLGNRQPEYLIDTSIDHAGAVSMLTSSPLPEDHVLEKLLDWSEEQPEFVQDQVHKFLTEEIELEELLEILKLFDVQTQKPKKPKKANMTDLIRRELEKGPRTKDELYQLARTQSSSKRPNAAVRQILRRLTSSWEIVEDNGAYRLTTEQ